MNVCIFGSASDEIDNIYFSEVKKLCDALAKEGLGLVFGAGSHGMMGQAARSFNEQNAKEIVGVVPSFFNTPGVIFAECSELIFTDTMRQRKQIMDDRSDIFIAVPGGVGTLEEMFEIITLRQLGQTNKHIIIYNVNGYYDLLLEFIATMQDRGFMRKTDTEHIFHVCSTTEEVIKIIREEQND